MRILLTGAGGMLGQAVVRVAARAGHEPVALSRRELDVDDAESTRAQVAAARPQAVINCAAYTDVDGAEADRDASMRTNADGARHVAVAAAAVGASVVYPSTDYVFDGEKGEPYVESDETRPLSAYGESKLAGERETALANPSSFVVRSSWLFGPGGRNFVETMLTLARDRDEVAVVHDQVGCPTYTGHLAEALVGLVEGRSYGLHHAAAAGRCSWAEFAEEIFRRAGVSCRVRAITTQEFGRPAPRPPLSVLVSEREDAPALPAWRDGLATYLGERGSA